MTIEEALLKAAGLVDERFLQENAPGHYGSYYRSGPTTVDASRLQRGIISCPHCGAVTGMGTISVRHDDGRTVDFHPQLFHYAQAGHPITAEDVDRDALVAIMSDL